MKNKKLEDKEKTLIDQYKNIKYFCPSPLCRTLFEDIHNDHKIIEKKQNYAYQCKYCNRHFNRSTYRDKAKCGKPYKIPETIKLTKEAYYELHIGDLWDKHYTNEEIHIITHFSEELIGNITTKYWNNVVDISPREEFIKKYLLKLGDFSKEIERQIPVIDFRKHKVRKLFRLGAGIPQIAKILKMGNNTIEKDLREMYISEAIKDEVRKKRRRAEETNTEAELTEYEGNILPIIKQFLEKAEPSISNINKRNLVRSRIKYDPKSGKVRVFARKKIITTSSPHTD